MIRWYVVTATDTIEEITDRVRTPDPEGSEGFDIGANADEGSAGSFSLSVDDPDADLLLLNHRRVYAIAEAAPAGHQRVGNWWISDIDVIRGDSDRTGASRTYVLTLEDENSIIPRKIFLEAGADRPAETDIERIPWWLSTTEGAAVKDTLYLDTTGPVDLDASNLLHQRVDSMLASCKDASGKNYFIWFNELAVAGTITTSSVANPTVITTSAAHDLLTGAEITIAGHSGSTPDINGVHTVTVIDDTTFTIPVNVTVGGTGGTVVEPRYSLAYFNPNTYTAYASAISLSNVASEIDSTTVFAISDDTRLNRAGGRIASRIDLPFPGGYATDEDTVIRDRYVSRDVAAPSINVKTQAMADAQATRQLAELDEPDDEVTTYITVTEANINAVMHGMTIPLHATHFPGFLTETGYPTYQSGQLMRVTKRQVRQVAPEAFEIHLWLSPMAAPPTCAESVTDAVTAQITDQVGASGSYSIAVTPTAHSAIIAGFVAGGTGMSLSGAGFTQLYAFANTGHETLANGWAVASSLETVLATYSRTGNPQAAVIAAFKTTASAPVQSKVGGWDVGPLHAILDSPPTPGNLLVAVVTGSANNTPMTLGPSTGWFLSDSAIAGGNQLAFLAEGQCNGVHPFGGDAVAIFAACVGEGWGQDWRYGGSGSSSNKYSVTVMEWAL